jgi:phospholipid N-methyltransferase
VKRKSLALLFAKNFFKHPRKTGAIIPSSPFLIRSLLAQIDWGRTRVVVEFGPGTGNITREILRRMPPDAVLITIESNEDFVHILQNTITDPRLRVIHGSAANVSHATKDLGPTDYIISSLPLTTMPVALRAEILFASSQVLRPGGTFITYQYTPAVASELEPLFGQIDRGFTLLNFPPALVYHCSR